MNEWPKVTVRKSGWGQPEIIVDFEDGQKDVVFFSSEGVVFGTSDDDLKKIQCAIDNYFMNKNVEGVCSNQSKLQ